MRRRREDEPDGQELAGIGSVTDAALSAWLGKPVTLIAASESGEARAEYFADATDDESQAIEWTMPKDRFLALALRKSSSDQSLNSFTSSTAR